MAKATISLAQPEQKGTARSELSDQFIITRTIVSVAGNLWQNRLVYLKLEYLLVEAGICGFKVCPDLIRSAG
jgi:hypothetical protein